MNKKTLIVLILILILGIAGEVMLNTRETQKAQVRDNTSVALEGNFLACTKDKVSKIYYKNGEESVTFTQADGKWKVNDADADQAAVETFITNFSATKMGDLVSRNKDNYFKMGVEQGVGIELAVVCSGNKSTYYVSIIPVGQDSFYIRKDGVDGVYQASGNLMANLRKKADDWKLKPENK